MSLRSNTSLVLMLSVAYLATLGSSSGCGDSCSETCSGEPGASGTSGASDADGGNDTDGKPAAPSSDAVTEFVTAFYDADYESVGDHIAALDAMVKAEPDNGHAVLYSALARMWRLGEEKRDPTFDLAQRAPMALKALDLFQEASAMLPDDDRIPAWIGFMTTRIGEATGSQTMIDKGEELLAASVETFPTFTRFVRAIGLLGHAHDDPDFAEVAPADMWRVLEACGYDVDRDNLSIDYPERAPTGDARICVDIPQAKHNWKGFFLHAGDVFSKAGDAKTAVAMWEHSKKSPTYAMWPERGALQERIDTAADRVAKLTDDDPDNDPELFAQSAHTCVGCHAD